MNSSRPQSQRLWELARKVHEESTQDLWIVVCLLFLGYYNFLLLWASLAKSLCAYLECRSVFLLWYHRHIEPAQTQREGMFLLERVWEGEHTCYDYLGENDKILPAPRSFHQGTLCFLQRQWNMVEMCVATLTVMNDSYNYRQYVPPGLLSAN